MQAPRFMREKLSRELYNTCGLQEALEDFARFSRDFYMNFNHFSAVPRDRRVGNFSNHCGIHTTAAIIINLGLKLVFRISGPSDWRTFGLAGLRPNGASD